MKLQLLTLIASIAFTKSTVASLPKVLIDNCYDGDTCTTFEGEKIRLACIDTPELYGKKAKPEEAKKAKNFLNSLIANQEVNIRRINYDKYGRTIGELFKNDVNIQKLIFKFKINIE